MLRLMTEEITFWKGSPSQWLNIWPFTGAVLIVICLIVGGVLFIFPLAFAALILPFTYVVWKYLSVRTLVFDLTSERLRVTSGILNQKIDEIELYRVKDTQMIRSWWMRLTGLASIVLETSDRGMPTLTIPAVRGGLELREQLRKQVELVRDQKRVREMDFDEAHVGEVGHD